MAFLDGLTVLTDYSFWLYLGLGMLTGQAILWGWEWIHPRWKLDTLATCFLLTIVVIILLGLYVVAFGLQTPFVDR